MSCLAPCVQSLLVGDPLLLSPDVTVLDAVKQMAAQTPSSESLVVLEDGQVVGVFTAQDVVTLIAQHGSLDRLLLQDVLQRSIVTLCECDLGDIPGTIAFLNRHPVQYLAIVREDNHLRGIIRHDRLREVLSGAQNSQSLATELEASQNLYANILAQISDAVFIADGEGNLTFVCPNVTTIFGYSEAEVWEKQRIQAFLGTPDFNPILLDQRGEICNLEHQIYDKTGKEHTVLINIKQVEIGQGRLMYTCRDITEVRAAESKLRRLNERFQLATQAAKLGIWDWDIEQNWLIWDEQMYKLYGTDPSPVGETLETWQRCLHPADAEQANLALITAIQGEQDFKEIVFRVIYPDGSIHWIEAHGVVERNAAGLPIRITGMNADITHRVVAENRLKESQQFLQTVFDSFPLNIFWKDSQGITLGCNQQFCQSLGFSSPEEVIGKTAYELSFTQEEADRFWADDQEVMSTGRAKLGIEEQFTRPDGCPGWAETNKMPLRNLEGQVIGVLGTFQEITDRKRAELDLQASEARFRRVFESNTVGMFFADFSGPIVDANDRFLHIVGYTTEDLRAGLLNWKTLTPPDYYEQDQQITQCLAERGEIDPYEKEYYRKDGSRVPIMLGVSLFSPSDTRCICVILDMTDQKAAERQLKATLQELSAFKAAIDASAIVATTDPQGRITSVNDRFCEISGYDREALLGQTHRLVNSGYHPPEFFSHLWRTLRQGKLWRGEVCNRTQGGKLYWVDTSIVPIWDDSDRITQYLAIRFDITERREMEDELRRAKIAAEAATQAKSEFLANMSHEIRTPLNAIIGMSELALETDLTSQQKNYIKKVQRSGQLLLRIINDILDFSKIEANKLELEYLPFNLREVMTNLESLLGFKTEEKRLTLSCSIDPNLPPLLLGDSLRISQILINLGNNAVKFTDFGEVNIRADVLDENYQSVRVQFSITDTGIGITPQQQTKLFQSFSQADSSMTRKYGGTGLGLVICKKLTELMGGEIGCDSEVGVGSRFYFTVSLAKPRTLPVPQVGPCSDTDCPLDPLDPMEEAIAFLQGAKILVVEDNEINQELIQDLLTHHGLQIELANNGQEALDKLEQETFDGVLMDIQMPVMNGYTATERIRQQDCYRTLPIIAMTANALNGDDRKALEVGMNAHIVKPVSINNFFQTLARWVKWGKVDSGEPDSLSPFDMYSLIPESSVYDSQTVMLPEALPAMDGIDQLQGLRNVENITLYRKLLMKFRERYSSFVQEFRSEQHSQDVTAATRYAHSLKGVAATLGITSVQDAALSLELTCKKMDDPATIETQIMLVQQALEPILEVLQGLDPDPVGNALEQTDLTIPLDTLRSELQRLDAFLAEDNAEALQVMETIEALLPSCSLSPSSLEQIRSMQRAIECYEFEQALEALRSLNALYIPVTSVD